MTSAKGSKFLTTSARHARHESWALHGTLGTHSAPRLHPITSDLYLLLDSDPYLLCYTETHTHTYTHRGMKNCTVNVDELKLMVVLPTHDIKKR